MVFDRLSRVATRWPIALFLVLVIPSAWTYSAVYELTLAAKLSGTAIGRILPNLGTWGPLIALVIIHRLRGTNPLGWIRSQIVIRNAPRWFVFAFAAPLAIQTLDALLYVAAGVPIQLNFPVVRFVLVFSFTLLLLGSLEEFGWRGFMQPILQRRYNPTLAAVLVGVAWAVWHLVALFSGALGGMPPGWFLYHLLPISVIMAWLYNRTKGVVPVMIFHAAHNAPGSFLVSAGEVPAAVSGLIWPVISGLWTLAALAVVLYAGTDLAAPLDSEDADTSEADGAAPA